MGQGLTSIHQSQPEGSVPRDRDATRDTFLWKSRETRSHRIRGKLAEARQKRYEGEKPGPLLPRGPLAAKVRP